MYLVQNNYRFIQRVPYCTDTLEAFEHVVFLEIRNSTQNNPATAHWDDVHVKISAV